MYEHRLRVVYIFLQPRIISSMKAKSARKPATALWKNYGNEISVGSLRFIPRSFGFFHEIYEPRMFFHSKASGNLFVFSTLRGRHLTHIGHSICLIAEIDHFSLQPNGLWKFKSPWFDDVPQIRFRLGSVSRQKQQRKHSSAIGVTRMSPANGIRARKRRKMRSQL